MGRPQFEQTCAVFASSKPDRPARRFQQGQCAWLDVNPYSARGAEQAALDRIAEEETREARTEVERGRNGHQTLAASKRFDPKEAEHVADVVRPARVQPEPQLRVVG